MKKTVTKNKKVAGVEKMDTLKKSASKKDARPSWDEYFMAICETVGQRGTCDRGRSGAVIVKDKHILTTGYVGSPPGIAHCDEVGHEMHKVTHDDGTETMHCIRTTHAEQNAIVQAARMGIRLEGATIYCKMVPCYSCAKSVIGAGIKRVVAFRDYHASKQSKRIFKESGIKLDVMHNETESYKNM